MYGDSAEIRELAARLRRRAEEVRETADRLAGRVARVEWRGRAAEAMRVRVRAGVGDLRAVAGDYERAAAALERHADEVDRLNALIARIEQRVRSLVSEARGRLGGLADGLLGDPLDRLLDHLPTPPSGHKDWLTLSIPGVRL